MFLFGETAGCGKCSSRLKGQSPVGFALYFHNFFHLAWATWALSRRLVREAGKARQKVTGRALLIELARIAREPGLRPDGMGCA